MFSKALLLAFIVHPKSTLSHWHHLWCVGLHLFLVTDLMNCVEHHEPKQTWSTGVFWALHLLNLTINQCLGNGLTLGLVRLLHCTVSVGNIHGLYCHWNPPNGSWDHSARVHQCHGNHVQTFMTIVQCALQSTHRHCPMSSKQCAHTKHSNGQ